MDKGYVKNLENIIKQMLAPIKNIPFNIAIEVLTGKKVIFFNENNAKHKKIMELIKKAILYAGMQINKVGIKRTRANEVGNDIESFVIEALRKLNIQADIPTSQSGSKQKTGYPDICANYNGVDFYAECKTYNKDSIDSSFRSFFLSPAKNNKVIKDALHFLLSFEMYVYTDNGKIRIYKCKEYKLISLNNLSLDIKHEFNSDNKKLYSNNNGAIILAQGKIL